ncbi:MAG: NAAT family transporter [Xylophilus ampelinus]
MPLPLHDYALAFGKSLLLTVATLLPIINPPSTATVFLSLTDGASDATRRTLAGRIARNVFLLMLACTLMGSYVLDFFGISLDIVRVGGGLLVVAIGWRLLHATQAASAQSTRLAEAFTPEMVNRTAFYPLSFPITCGPGTLAATITVGVSLSDPSLALGLARTAGAVAGLGLVALTVLLCYRYAQHLLRPLGETGTVVFLRLSAFILLCLGVQILWDGASELLVDVLRRGLLAADRPLEA